MNEQKNSDMLVDIVDWRGIPIAAPMPFVDAQAKRLGYRSFHVWILRETDNGRIEVLLRRRATGVKSDGGPFDNVVTGGPVWDYVARVNQALMDAALGFEYRCDAIANGRIIVP